MIVVGILGIGLIAFAIYTLFAYKQQKNHGVKVKAVVTEIESITMPYKNGDSTQEGYVATLEFDLDGKHYSRRCIFSTDFEKNKTVLSKNYSIDIFVEFFEIHQLEVGEIVEAIYFEKGNKYSVSVNGLGFDKGSAIFGATFEFLLGIPMVMAFLVEFGVIELITYAFIWLITTVLVFLVCLCAAIYKKNNPDSSFFVSTIFDKNDGNGHVNSNLTRYKTGEKNDSK